MSNEHRTNNNSNVQQLSLALLLGGAALVAAGYRMRSVLSLPVVALGALSALSGASMRKEANEAVSSVAGDDSLWVRLKSSVSVMRPSRQLYEYWRDVENWPKFMPDVEVECIAHDRFELSKHIGPGVTLKQEILIIEDLPGQRISWMSMGDELPHEGSVDFTTNGGTYVTLSWAYKVACGPLLNFGAKRFIRQLNEVMLVKLQRFKQIAETGGATTYGATAARHSGLGMLFKVLMSDADRALSNLTEPETSESQA